MPKTVSYDEGHYRFVAMCILLGIIAVLSWIHWRVAMPILVSKFNLTLITYAYYGVIWIGPSIVLFFLGNAFLVQRARKRKVEKLAIEGRLSVWTAMKRGLGIKPSAKTIKKDIKMVKETKGISPHRIQIIIVSILMIALPLVLHAYMLANYLWKEVHLYYIILQYEGWMFSGAYLSGFGLGLLSYLPFRNRIAKKYTV